MLRTFKITGRCRKTAYIRTDLTDFQMGQVWNHVVGNLGFDFLTAISSRTDRDLPSGCLGSGKIKIIETYLHEELGLEPRVPITFQRFVEIFVALFKRGLAETGGILMTFEISDGSEIEAAILERLRVIDEMEKRLNITVEILTDGDELYDTKVEFRDLPIARSHLIGP